jgi:hypothetical protein
VFICKEGPHNLSPQTVEVIREVAGRQLAEIVYYPANRRHRRGGHVFALALREAIYTARRVPTNETAAASDRED